MAERKHKGAGLTVAVIAFILSAAVFFTVAVGVSNELPRVMEYSRSRLSDGVTFSDYDNLPVSYDENLAVCAELEPETVDRIGEVKPVLINEYFFDVYQLHVGGSAITADHIEHQQNAVVISDSAALKLSPDANVVGRTISLLGKEFTIVGVYHQPDGFLREISSDVYDRVYLPYTCYEGYPERSIDTLAAPKGTFYEKALRLLGMTGTDTGFYIENDIAVKHDMVESFIHWFIAAAAAVLALTALWIILGLYKRSSRKLRAEYEHDHLSVVLKRNWLYLLLRVLLMPALIAVPVVLVILFPPQIVLPRSYVPYENIFEVSHYLKTFTERIRLTNGNFALGNGYYLHLFTNTMLRLSAAYAVMLVSLAVIAARIRAFIKAKLS